MEEKHESPQAFMGEFKHTTIIQRKKKSTVNNYKRARELFNDFLSKSKLPPLPLTAESAGAGTATMEQVCRILVMEKFADYLCERGSDDDDDPFGAGTAKQHLSGAKMVIESIWGSAAIENNDSERAKQIMVKVASTSSDAWYTSLRNDLEKAVVDRCINLGMGSLWLT